MEIGLNRQTATRWSWSNAEMSGSSRTTIHPTNRAHLSKAALRMKRASAVRADKVIE
jgi:hypothetical protein